jgi:S1-C subfamily serine protease
VPPVVPPVAPQTPAAAPAAEPAAQTPSQSSSGTIILVAAIVAFVVAGFAGVAGGYIGAKAASGGSTLLSPAQKVTVVPSKTNEPVVAAAAAAVPSVVNIDVKGSAADSSQDGLPESHPGVPMMGSGSGVAFRAADGGTYILTNNHVVENANVITVRDASGKSVPGKLVGRDPETDIAVVQVADTLPVIDLGTSTGLRVGQTVVAIGSPFGLEHSVTSGVISAIGRSLPDFGSGGTQSNALVDVIQTDAAINPGNSGGALVDRAGKLIGINTAIYSDTGASGGIGFAIPVNTAVRVAEQLIDGGKVSHPFLGIVGETVNPELAAAKKLTTQEGAYVSEVIKDTGAERAGVLPGDTITGLDGARVRSMDDLILQVRRHKVGDVVTLTVERDGSPIKIKMTVGDKPANLSTKTKPAPVPPSKDGTPPTQ